MKKQLVILLIMTFVLSPLSAGFNVNSVAAQTKSDLKFREDVSRTLPVKTKLDQIQPGQTEIEKEKFDQFQKIEGDKVLETKSVPKSLERLDYVPGEVLVKFKERKINLENWSGRLKAKNFAFWKGLEKKEDIKKSNISVLKTKSEESVESMVEKLKNDPNVEYVQPNFLYYPLAIDTNDTYRDKLWGLDNYGQEVGGVSGTPNADINILDAWAISEGDEDDIIVAVIDSGVAYNHPDLADNMWDGSNCLDDEGNYLGGCNHGYDYEDSDKTPLPTSSSHGTHIAGTIAAVKNNNKGIVGVAPNVKIMALKGLQILPTNHIVKGVNFAKHNGAKVINASWGNNADNCNDIFDQALYEAIQDFDGLFVAAAGNDGENHNGSTFFDCPSDYGSNTSCWSGLDNIISVAATDQDDNLVDVGWWSSDYGEFVDVGAPGVSIYSTVNDTDVLNEIFDEVIPPGVPSGWVKSGVNNKWATYDFSGDKVLYGQVPSFPYDNNTDSTITSPIFNLGGNTIGATIDFYTRCDTEYTTTEWFDYMALEVSNDGVNFTEQLRWDEAYLDLLNGDSSDIGGAVYFFENLTIPSQYLSGNFQFRLRWFADPFVNNYDGCWVDDIKITKYTDGSDEQYAYGYMQGTSMAAPHVAGLAGLIWGYKPELDYSEVKNTILTTGDDIADLDPETGTHPISTGKRINAYNALNSLSEKKPPYAVAIDNQKDARPISGINEADVVYEFPVEGSITRFMAIYNPDSGVNPSIEIGPVRSARPYFARTASEHNAIYAHAGGTDAALQGLINNDYNVYNLDALTPDGEDYFWRDNDREMPHNLYTSIEKLNNYREDIYLTGGSFSQPWIFSNDPASIDAVGYNKNEINVNYDNINYNVKWVYNSTDELYYRQTYEDGNYQNYIDINENQVFTKNLAVQYAITDSFTELSQTNGDALLCRGGKCINGLWRKDSMDSNVKFYINSGNEEFEFKTGKLWINVTNQVTDITPPVITEEISVPTPTNDNTPDYTFSSDEAGTITYDGGCSSDDTTADIGENAITFNTLADGLYNSCTIVVTDAVGNQSEPLNITEFIIDTQIPVITLIGDNPVNLYVGDTYVEYRANAIDNIGIIEDITIDSSDLNISEVGTYFVTYNVSDSAGNPATEVTRTVNVVAPLNSAKDITAFSFSEGNGVITGTNIAVTVPFGTDVTALIPTITLSGGTVSPLSEVAQDFTNPVVYTVTAEDGTTQDYTVTVTVAQPSDLTSLTEAIATAQSKHDAAVEGNLPGQYPAPLKTNLQTAINNASAITNASAQSVVDVAVTTLNSAIATFKASVVPPDTIAPVITLTGSNANIYQDTSYNDAGATALDNSDGNITNDIVTTGIDSVDTDTPGIYYIHYNVIDNAGNPATEVSRTVTVLALAENQTTLTSNTTINASSTEVMIGSNAPGSSTISIPSSINNAGLNVSALMSGTDATLPTDLTINSETSIGEVNIQIPQSTLMSGGAGWNGVINLPQVQENSSVTVTPDSGYSASVSSVLEIGYGDVELTFDQAVRIKLTGQAGRYIGYSRNGTFTPITAICSADSQAAGNALAAGGNCKIDVGSDLVIWTKHFTKFATYTQTVNQPAPSSSSGGGGGGSYVSYTPASPSILINNGENTTFDNKVTLKLSATNMNASYSPQMMISNFANFTGSEWISYATSTDWTLIDGEGVHTVYVKFKNRYGTTSVVSDAIELKIAQAEETQQTPPEVEELVVSEPQTTVRVLGAQVDMNLSKRLKGRLLLQVEQGGAIWYVDTNDYQRYSVTLDNALPLFKRLSLGITDADLSKIPIAGSSQVGSLSMRNSLKGKLLLQVEQGGAIWYVDKDGYRHSVTWNNLMDLFRRLALGITDENLYKIVEGNLSTSLDKTGKVLGVQIDKELAERLKGQILLQVESVGEAYYVYPDDSKKYYLGRPADAFSIMRNLGLGIINTDLIKIPKSDENFTGDYNLRQRLAGKILLQVEENGEAWYIYPDDLKRYYMGRPDDAFNLMRKLGLGITDNDLRKIDVGEVE